MEAGVTIAGALLGAVFGWFAAGHQHHLYRQPEYRTQPPSGGKLLTLRLFLALVCAAGVGIALRPAHYDAWPAILTALFVIVLSVLSSTDFERRIIPNRLVYPAILAAAVLCWVWPDRSVLDIAAGAAFAVAVAAFLFVFGIVTGSALGVRGTAFGMGDVRLIVLLGLLLGWPLAMSGLFIGVIAAGVPALVLMLAGRSRKFFSYGPFLALGGAIVMLWPERFL